jgi:L-lactate dehydrogenase complex protein LldG
LEEEAMNSGQRETILGRIREALRSPAPGRQTLKLSGTAQIRAWLPAVPPDPKGQLELFRKNCAELKTEFYLVGSATEAARTLGALQQSKGWKRAASHRHPLVEPVVTSLELPTLFVERSLPIEDLEKCSVGITACDLLIAQTGSILVTSRSAGGRGLSVLPPHHVVLAERKQLVPDLPDAFEYLQKQYCESFPSFATFITGPSRTGDIERILVLGAHGPRELTVILIGSQ